MDKRHWLDEKPFSYQATKDNKVLISWHGKLIKVLKGKLAEKLIHKLTDLDTKEQQLELAKVTGNFKRGNER
ncbi:MAG: hypothetical protein JXB30_12830 [Anaerolineae bacterium]|nr:hypothetical protein [Anaerolineae bacterium]